MRVGYSWLAVGPAFALCSCSIPHPLQDDVTGLPLSAIIRKITCEAQEALDNLLVDEGVVWMRKDYKDANIALKRLTKRVLKPLEDEGKQLQKKKKELDFLFAANQNEIDTIRDILQRLVDKKLDPPDRLEARQGQLLTERDRLLNESAVYIRAVRKHNRDLALAESRINAATKETKKRTKSLARYYNHQMAYSFRFRIVETNVASVGVNWRLPVFLNNPGTWTIGGSAGDTKERESDRNAKLVISFEDLHGTDCTDAPPQAGRLRSIYYPIRGKIGVEEVIAQYLALLERARRDQAQAAAGDDDKRPSSMLGRTSSRPPFIRISGFGARAAPVPSAEVTFGRVSI